MKSKKIRIALFVIAGIIITYPFTLQLISGCLKFDYDELYTFNMPLNEFTISWIAFWGLVCSIVGVFQVFEKLHISRIQHKELIMTQYKQLNTQIQNNYLERYYSCVNMLNSDNEIVRLNAIINLYLLAKDSDMCAESICGNFCDILCSDGKHSRKEKQRVVNYLFNKDCNIFGCMEKNINDCHLVDLYFIRANIINTNFNNTVWKNCEIHKSEIIDSCFIGAEFRKVLFRTTQIKHSNFRHSIISKETNFNRFKIDDVIFSQVVCNGAMFNSGYINKCDFSMAKVSQSRFSNVKFIKCVLELNEMNQTTVVFSEPKYREDFINMLPAKYENMIHVQGNVLFIP